MMKLTEVKVPFLGARFQISLAAQTLLRIRGGVPALFDISHVKRKFPLTLPREREAPHRV